MPLRVAEGAVIETGSVLVAVDLAVLAERAGVEPVTVAVEASFCEVFVPFDFVS